MREKEKRTQNARKRKKMSVCPRDKTLCVRGVFEKPPNQSVSRKACCTEPGPGEFHCRSIAGNYAKTQKGKLIKRQKQEHKLHKPAWRRDKVVQNVVAAGRGVDVLRPVARGRPAVNKANCARHNTLASNWICAA